MSESADNTIKRVPVVKNLKLYPDGVTGVFLGRRCRNCGEYFMDMPIFCLNCSSSDFELVELSRQGILLTYTVIYVPPLGWQGQVPYILGSVQLPEGIEVLTEVINLPKDKIKIGMKMEMVLQVGGKDTEGNEIMLYKWQPAA
jgi:uncharacterized OB-fold protein